MSELAITDAEYTSALVQVLTNAATEPPRAFGNQSRQLVDRRAAGVVIGVSTRDDLCTQRRAGDFGGQT